MLLWNKKEVSRGHWMDIFESDYVFVLKDNSRGKLLLYDFAEETVCVHRGSILGTTMTARRIIGWKSCAFV